MPADLNYLLQARRNRYANPAGGARTSGEDPMKDVEEEAFQAESKRLAAQAKAQEAEDKANAKSYEKGRKDAEKEALRARNNEMEAKARREKRPIYTDADGRIQSQYTDEEWEAKKKLKAKNDQLRTQYFKENRPWVEDAEGNMIARHTDEEWNTLKAEKAAKEKAKLLDEQAKAYREQKGQALTNVDDQAAQVMRGLDLEGQDLTLKHKAKLDTVKKADSQIRKLNQEIEDGQLENEQPLNSTEVTKRREYRDKLIAERDKVQAETDEAEAKLRAHEVRKLEYSKANNEVQGWLQKQKHGLKTEMPPVVMGVRGAEGAKAGERAEGTPEDQSQNLEAGRSARAPLASGSPITEEVKAEAVRKAVIEGRISALAEDDSLSDEERKAGLTRLMLQRDDPKAYETQVLQEFEALPPEKLSETLDSHVQDFEQRKQDWQARRDALRQQTAAVNAEVDGVLARNAQRLQQPHKPADLVTYTTGDGGKVSVFKDLVPQLEQAQEKAGTFEKQHQAEMDQINAEGGMLERAAKLIHAGGGVLQKKQETGQVAAKAERQQVYDQLNAIPGAKLGDELAKVDEAVAKHQGGDDVSLHEWAKQERDKIIERAKAMPEQAKKFYEEWGKKLDYDWTDTNPEFSGVDTNMGIEAKKYGITDKEGARYWLTTYAQADWSRPNNIGGKEIDPAKQDVRFLPNGNITVNPGYLLDKAGYEQVVKDSKATPEAKKQALAVRKEIAPELATQALEALRQNSDMSDWIKANTSGTDLERMEQFTAQMKAGGWTTAALMRFQAAAAGIGASWMGTAGAVTGSDTFLQADVPSLLSADWWKKRADSFSQAAGVAEKGTDVLGKYAAMAVGGLPSVLESVAVGAATGGAASLARAGKLAKTLSAATKAKNFKQGQAAIDAFNKGIQTVSVAGAAIDAGIQQGGSTFNDAYQHYLEQELGKITMAGDGEFSGPSKEEVEQAKARARAQALKPALLDALQTAGLTALGGAKGAEALLRTGADAAVKKAFKTGLGKVLAGIGMDAGEEFLEEYANQFVSGVIAQASYNPKLTVKEVFSQALDAGIVGGLLGGGMGTVKAVGEYRAEKAAARNAAGMGAAAEPAPEKRTETTQGTEGTLEGSAVMNVTAAEAPPTEGAGRVVTPEAAGAEAANSEPNQSQLVTGASSTEAGKSAHITPEAAKPTVEEARAELASFAPEGMAPHQIEATKAKAEVLLRMAQGETMQDFTDEELRTVGLNRDGTPGHYEAVAVDKKNPDAGRTSVWKKGVRPDGFQPVVVEDGELIITQRQVDNLKKRLPAVAAQIGKSEVERRREIGEKGAPAAAAQEVEVGPSTRRQQIQARLAEIEKQYGPRADIIVGADSNPDQIRPRRATTPEEAALLKEVEGINAAENSNSAPTSTADNGVSIDNLDGLLANGGGVVQVSQNGRKVAYDKFGLSIDGNTAEVAFVELATAERGKGIGYDAYIALGKALAAKGITLQSSKSQYGAGRKLWEKLAAQGLATKGAQGVYSFTAPAEQSTSSTTTPDFQNVVHATPAIQIGKANPEDHVTEAGYAYRTMSAAELADMHKTGELRANPTGKSRGGRKNVKHWDQGGGGRFYRKGMGGVVVRVPLSKLQAGKPVSAQDVEVMNTHDWTTTKPPAKAESSERVVTPEGAAQEMEKPNAVENGAGRSARITAGFDPAVEQRVDEIATELSSRGLSGEQALKAARGVVQRMGVMGPKYEVQMIDPAFEEAMKAEGFQRDPAKMSRWIVKGQFKAETQAEKAARREGVEPEGLPQKGAPSTEPESRGQSKPEARATPLIERSDWKQAQGEVIAAMQARAKGLPEAAKKAAAEKIKAVVKRFNKLEELIDTKFGRLFEGVRIMPNGSHAGGGLAVQATGYDKQGWATGVELQVDAAAFAENGGLTDAELERALNEEWQHRADLMVMSRSEAVDLAKSIHAAQPGVFNAAWKQYFAVGIKEGSVPAKPPVDLTDDEAYMLYFEASRMIRQGTFTSENAAIRDVGLLQRMYLWLSRYVNFVQREMKKLPQDLRELWEDKLTAAEAVMGKMKAEGIRLQKEHLDDVEPPERAQPKKVKAAEKGKPLNEDEEALAMAADAEMDTRPARKGAMRNPGENAIRGMKSIPDPDTGKENVVMWINQYHGRITRPSKGWLARMAQEGKDRSKIGDWDDIQQAGIPSFYSSLVFKNGNGSTLDQALQELHGMGYFPGVEAENVTGEMLASKILDVIERYQAKKQGGATTVQDEEQAHFERLEAQRVEFERSTATGPIYVKPHEMQPGDVMMVKADDGKMHRVEVLRLDTEPVPAGEEFDPDANPAQFMGPDGPMQIQSVTLRDGTTFGVQTIDGQQGLFVDAFSVRQEGDFYAGLSDAVQNRSIDDADAVLRVMQHEGMDATTPFSQIVLAIQQNLRVPMRRAQKMLAQVMDTDANATVWTNEELKQALESPLSEESKPKAKKPAKPKLVDLLRAYFVPGKVVKSYGGFDRVVSLDASDPNDWSVTVHAVRPTQGERINPSTATQAQIDALEWQDVPLERERTHATLPAQKEMEKSWEKDNAASTLSSPRKQVQVTAAQDAPRKQSEPGLFGETFDMFAGDRQNRGLLEQAVGTKAAATAFSLESVSSKQLDDEMEKAARKAKMTAKQAAPLQGSAGEYGTPDLLDITAGPMALFSQPTPQKGTLFSAPKQALQRVQENSKSQLPPARPDLEDFLPPKGESRKGHFSSAMKQWKVAFDQWKAQFESWVSQQGKLGAFLAQPVKSAFGPMYQRANVVTPLNGGGWRMTVFGRYEPDGVTPMSGDWSDGAWVPIGHEEFSEKVPAYKAALSGMDGAEFTRQALFSAAKQVQQTGSLFGNDEMNFLGDRNTLGLFEQKRPVAPSARPSTFSLEATTPEQLKAEAERRELREKLQQRAEQPLVGTMGDLGQMDMLGGGDLFSQGNPAATPQESKPALNAPDKVNAPEKSAENGRIEDFGEKIGGARKDGAPKSEKRTGPKETDSEDPGWRRRYDVAEIVSGYDKGRWSIIDLRSKDWTGQPKHAIRDTFPTEQAALDAIPLVAVSRNHAVYSVGTAIGAPSAQDVSKSIEANMAAIDALRKGNERILMAEKITARLKSAMERGEIDAQRYAEMVRDGTALNDIDYARAKDIAAKIRALIETPTPEQKAKEEATRYGIFRNVTDRKRVQVVPQTFDSREEALRYMAANAADIIEKKTNFGEEIIVKPENAVRVGPERRTKPADAKMFQEAFGFRGVEFGNWMRDGGTESERQEVLNHAYDGLHDLAETLGIPPKAISLNGDLALAFGARGHGLSGAKAHYERDYGVINLTKMAGAGSLAHEWFHALDHYLGRQDGKAARERQMNKEGHLVYASKGREGDYVSHGLSRNTALRETLRPLWKSLIDRMMTKAEQFVEDTQKAEKFVNASRQALVDYLGELRKDLAKERDPKYYKRNYKAASQEQLDAFDTLTAKLIEGEDMVVEHRYNKAGDTPANARGAMSYRWSNDTLDAMGVIYKAVRGRSGFNADQNGVIDTARQYLKRYADRAALLKSATEQESKTRMVPTEYAMNAKRIDQGRASDYWTQPHEMAARAFSAYVEDKLQEQGRASEFLSYGSDNNLPEYRLFNVRPFPAGDERAMIDGLFDQFFSHLQTQETEKGTMLFSPRKQSTVKTEKEVFDHRLAVAKAEIQQDMKDGVVPRGVGSFSELHDYVDANEYVNDKERADRMIGPLGKSLSWQAQEYVDFTNRLIGAVNEWLASGAAKLESDADTPVRAPMGTIDEAAHEAATSPRNDLAEPTEAQKEAGNYKLGHAVIGGQEISIENPAGSKRRPEWPVLKDHYGYLKGTMGQDGDHVDIFVKPGTPADYAGPVHVVRQNVVENGKATGKLDEYKVMMGYPTAEEARSAYLRNYTKGWPGLAKLTTHTMPEFEVIKGSVFGGDVGARGTDKVLAATDGAPEKKTETTQKTEGTAESSNETDRSVRAPVLGAPRKQSMPLEVLAKADWGRIDKALTGRLVQAIEPAAAAVKKKTGDVVDHALEMLAGWSVAGQAEASGATFKPAQKQELMDQTRRQLRRVWNQAVRQIVPDASLPADVLAKKREMTMNQALSNEVALDIGKRALMGKPKLSDLVVGEAQQNPEIRRKMFLAMNPKIDSGVTMASLNPEERRVAEALLQLRDDLGKRMVKAGRIGLQTFEAMREGTSHYYDHDVKKEKSMLRQMSLGLRNLFAQTATAFHIVDTQTKQPDGSPALVMHPGSRNRPTYRFDTQEQMRGFYEEFIKDQILQAAEKGNAVRYPWMTPADKAALAGVTRDSLNNPGRLSADQRAVVARLQEQLRQRFEKRVPLSYDEHSKAGLIEDPFYSVARQIAEMGHDVATAEFFNYIAGVPDYVRDAPTIGYTEMPDTAKLGALAGKHVRDDVAAEVQQLTELPGMGMKFYDALLGLFKTGKTVLNPGSHGRNIFGNIAFAHLAGSNPLNPGNAVYYADALRVLRDGGADYREMYESGVLGGDFLTGEVKRSLRQLVPNAATVLRDAESGNLTWLYGLKEHMARRWQGLLKKPGQGLELAATAWRLEDDIYKAAAYLKAKSMGMDSKQAAEHVREWFPYYDKGTSGTLKALGRFAFPFLSFKRESFRILKNGLTKKPLATIATLALPRLLTQIALTMGEMRLLMWGLGLGLKDERDKEDVLKALKGRAGRLLSPIAGDSSLFSILLPWRDDNGGLQQWDLSNTHPFGDWLATRTEDAESKEPWITRQAREMVSGSPFLGLLVESAFNKDSFTGRRIYEDDMSTSEAHGKLLEHAFTELAPPITPTISLPGGVKLEGTSARTIRKAFEQSPSKLALARNPTQALIRTLAGLDVRPADPNLYDDVAKYRAEHNLPAVPRGQQFPSDAAGRARAELYRLLIQPEPDVVAVKEQLEVLKKHGAKIPSVQDLFKDRQPQDVMKLKKHQARWINQLAPEARRVLEAAQKQQVAAKPGALDAMAKARAGG